MANKQKTYDICRPKNVSNMIEKVTLSEAMGNLSNINASTDTLCIRDGEAGITSTIDLIDVWGTSALHQPNGDLNNAIKTGFYTANFETKNIPINDYGLVRVSHRNPYVIQEFFALNQDAYYFRRSTNNGSSFNEWAKIV